MAFAVYLGFATSVIVFVLLSDRVNCQNVLKCMSCKRASHFTQCEEMVKCNLEREVCYVEEEIDIGGETVVNAGCREKEECNAIGCFGDENRRRRRSSGVREDGTKTNTGDLNKDIVCHHCCDGDFCNMYGCPDSFDVSHLLGSRCFVCDHVVQPEHCNIIKNCEPGYSCGLERVLLGDEERYTLQCIRKQKCDMLRIIHGNNSGRRKRNYIQLWAECCDSHLCNGYLPMKEDPPSMQSATYRCPPRNSNGNPASSGNVKTNTSQVSTVASPKTSTARLTSISKVTTSVTTTTKHTATTTTGEITCRDKDLDCYIYDEDNCKQYVDWAAEHCAKTCGICGIKAQDNPQYSLTLTTPSVSTTTETAVCKDTDPDCSLYGVDYICFGNYKEWAKQHCAKYCNFCGTGSDINQKQLPNVSSSDFTTSKTPAVCEDIDPDCSEYGVDYICKGNYEEWAKQHCAKYCGFCGTITIRTTKAGAACEDLEKDCADYGFDYICTGDYIPWSTIHCRKFCGLCIDTTTPVATSTKQTTTVPTTTVPTTNQTTQEPVTTTVVTPPPHCVDLDPDCAEYGNDYICQGDYIPWSKIHCNKTCNFCNECVDKDPDCADYGSDYICKGDYLPWSQIHCAKYCRLCVEATSSPLTTTAMNQSSTFTTTKATTTITVSTTMNPSTTESKMTTKPATTKKITTTMTTTTKQTTKKATTTEPTTPTTEAPTTTMKPTRPATSKTPTTTLKPTTRTSTTTMKPTTTEEPTTTLSPSEACGNKLQDCHSYGLEECSNPDKRDWMYDNCRGHCKMCLQNKPCNDEMLGCEDFKDMICSSPSESVMCKNTCGIC